MLKVVNKCETLGTFCTLSRDSLTKSKIFNLFLAYYMAEKFELSPFITTKQFSFFSRFLKDCPIGLECCPWNTKNSAIEPHSAASMFFLVFVISVHVSQPYTRTERTKHFKSLVFGCMESLRSLKMFFMRLKLDFARFMPCLISFSHLASAVSQDPTYLKS